MQTRLHALFTTTRLFSENCSGFNIDSWTGSVLSGSVPTSATIDYSYKMTLLVSGAVTVYGQRSSQAEIIIYISPADAPTVALQYVSSSRMNPSDSLKMIGMVGNVKKNDVNCTWSVNDASVDLPAVASTPTIFLLAPSSIGQSVLNFALPPATLRERTSFLFTLRCVLENSVYVPSASLMVSTNGPPLAGQFDVIPEKGFALNTSFMFLSSKWFDEDLPLSYHYGFVSSESLMTLVSRSEISYGNSTLPVGDELQHFNLQLFAQIFDVMNAQTTEYKTVTVSKTVIGTKQLNDLISTEISNGANSVDSTKKVISLVSSMMNNVDCSKSPDCTKLNRSPCKDVTNTCGVCVSSLFVSGDEDRPGNSPCIHIGSLQSSMIGSDGSNAAVEPTTCSNTNDCWGWKQCKQKFCVLPDKTCESDCSGHGKCKFKDEKRLVDMQSCKVGDASCTAYCVCDLQHSGSTCSKTLEEMKAYQKLREQLLFGLQSITKSEDVSPESLTSCFSNLGAITRKTDEISAKGGVTVADVLNNAASELEDKQMIVPPRSAVTLMGSLNNNIAIAKNLGVKARTRRLSASNAGSEASTDSPYAYPDYLKKPMDIISKFGEILANDMVFILCITLILVVRML